MRYLLLTAEGAEKSGDDWFLAPTVPLGDLPSNMMMPFMGDDVELRLPDGNTIAAHVASFGISVSRGDDGNFYSDSDLSAPAMTLSITTDADIGAIPAGTEVWLPSATVGGETEAATGEQ